LYFDVVVTVGGVCWRQVSGWHGDVHRRQIASQPVSGVSSQEMPADGNEQRRSVYYTRLEKERNYFQDPRISGSVLRKRPLNKVSPRRRRRNEMPRPLASATSSGHAATLTSGFDFLLVFCSNHSRTMYYRLGIKSRADRRVTG